MQNSVKITVLTGKISFQIHIPNTHNAFCFRQLSPVLRYFFFHYIAFTSPIIQQLFLFIFLLWHNIDKQNALRRECTFKIEIVLEIGVAGVKMYLKITVLTLLDVLARLAQSVRQWRMVIDLYQ